MSYKSSNTSYRPKPVSIDELPFVSKTKGRLLNFWDVPQDLDYGEACIKGREFAAHFVQYLKDNPGCAGSNYLGFIARDIDFGDKSETSGIWVGFFTYLEHMVSDFATNPFATKSRLDRLYSPKEH